MTRHVVEISEKAEKMPQTAQRDRGVGGKSTFSVTRGEDAVPARSRDTNNSPRVRLRPCSFPSRYVGKSRYCGFYSKGDAR